MLKLSPAVVVNQLLSKQGRRRASVPPETPANEGVADSLRHPYPPVGPPVSEFRFERSKDGKKIKMTAVPVDNARVDSNRANKKRESRKPR